MVSVTSVLDLDSSFSCPNCNAVLIVEPTHYEHAFDGHELRCHDCKQTFDLHRTMRHQIEHFGVMGNAMVFAGAKWKVCQAPLRASQSVTIDLTQFGVPRTAEVLQLNLTAQEADCAPVLLTGNDALKTRLGPVFHIHGIQHEAEEDRPNGKVNVSAIWFDAQNDDTAVKHLVEAATHFAARRYQSMVVPANVAVESSLSPVLAEWLSAFASRDHTQDFLTNAATYSRQLNVLVPIVAFMVDAPRMPDHLRGDLNSLRGLRNALAHTGTCDSLDAKRAAQLLTSSIFGMRYTHMMRDRVDAARKNGKLPTKP